MLVWKWFLLIINVMFFFANITSPWAVLHGFAILCMTVSIAAHDDMTDDKQ